MKFNLYSKNILIIEDYPVMRMTIKDMLYTLGAQYIFEAENGQQVLKQRNLAWARLDISVARAIGLKLTCFFECH